MLLVLVLALLAAKALLLVLLVLLPLALVQHLALRPLLSLAAGTPAVFPSSSGPPAVAH